MRTSTVSSPDQAATPESQPRAQEAGADAAVEPHAARHLGDVGADRLADVRDLVDERDLGGQERVGGQLDHLGTGDVGADDLGIDAVVEPGHAVGVGHRVGADHDPVGRHEVRDGGTLAQELGVREVGHPLQAGGVQLGPHLAPRADRHGRLHHQGRAVGAGRDRADDRLHPREVGVAGGHRRRVDADEREPHLPEQLLEVEREREPVAIAAQQLLEPRLVQGHLAAAEPRDLVGVDVAAEHSVAEVGEAGGRDEPDVAHSDHADRLAGHGLAYLTERTLRAIAHIVEFDSDSPSVFDSHMVVPFAVHAMRSMAAPFR